MATVSPTPSLHALCRANLKRQSDSKTETAQIVQHLATDNPDKRKQCEFSDSTSLLASVFSSRNVEVSNKFEGTAKKNASNLTAEPSKMSHSDTVAKCFECASYMPSYSKQPKPTSPNNVFMVHSDHVNVGGSRSCFLRPGTQLIAGSGGNFATDASAIGLGGGIVGGGCNSHCLLNESDSASGFLDSLWSERFYTTSLHSNADPSLSNSISVDPFNIWNTVNTNGLSKNMDLITSLNSNIHGNGVLENDQDRTDTISDTIKNLRSTLLSSSSSVNLKKSAIKRQMMIYYCKFGEFGVTEGQFTEPSGVAVNAQNYIIVADTNNHRIQIFDRVGRFKFQFGECGKRDSQLLYPNRVAVSQTTGDIIITERSPTHQIQIFNQYGQFVRKFGSNILQHPRGVTVDNEERIIVVECKVMRVIIFDHKGNILHKFGCSKHLRFPNGVVVNDKNEIFISDNRAHCVKVFNYEGRLLRQIGCEGLTNYPIGVCINSKGQIIIADNHNNFNLTIFTQDGQLVSAYESRVKHAQCFDVALIDDNSVVLASKDYRLYIYRFASMMPMTF